MPGQILYNLVNHVLFSESSLRVAELPATLFAADDRGRVRLAIDDKSKAGLGLLPSLN